MFFLNPKDSKMKKNTAIYEGIVFIWNFEALCSSSAA